MVKKDGADLLSTVISWAVNIAGATSPGLGLYVNLPALRKAKNPRQQVAQSIFASSWEEECDHTSNRMCSIAGVTGNLERCVVILAVSCLTPLIT